MIIPGHFTFFFFFILFSTEVGYSQDVNFSAGPIRPMFHTYCSQDFQMISNYTCLIPCMIITGGNFPKIRLCWKM